MSTNNDSDGDSDFMDYNEKVDDFSEEEYLHMLDNPILLPIHYWEKITEIKQFNSDPDVGTGTFYAGESPFGHGNFIDENGDYFFLNLTD